MWPEAAGGKPAAGSDIPSVAVDPGKKHWVSLLRNHDISRCVPTYVGTGNPKRDNGVYTN